jgi:hypothetical protein
VWFDAAPDRAYDSNMKLTAIVPLALAAAAGLAVQARADGATVPSGGAGAADLASPAPDAPAVALTGAGEYETRLARLKTALTTIESNISALEGRIATLESVALADPSETAHVVLIHRNEMGESFVLESLKYELDDAAIFNRLDPGTELNAKREFEIFFGRMRAGRHTIAVTMIYRGQGYGVYSYLKGYRFKIKSSYTFDATPAAKTCLKIVGYERESDSLELKDRPHVRYDPAPECKAMPLSVGTGPGAGKGDEKDKK